MPAGNRTLESLLVLLLLVVPAMYSTHNLTLYALHSSPAYATAVAQPPAAGAEVAAEVAAEVVAEAQDVLAPADDVVAAPAAPRAASPDLPDPPAPAHAPASAAEPLALLQARPALDAVAPRCARPAPVPAAPATQPRYFRMWGKYGLLNNRVRCLANAIGYAERLNATLVLSESWEQFTSNVFDTEWLAAAAPHVVVQAEKWPPPGDAAAAERTADMACMDVFWCGGICKRDKEAIKTVEEVWKVPDWRDWRAGGQDDTLHGAPLYRAEPEAALCGYAPLLPKAEVRELARTAAFARGWRASGASPPGAHVVGHHQRLQTTNVKEPVSMMCVAAAKSIVDAHYADGATGAAGAAWYAAVCPGRGTPALLLAAAAAAGEGAGAGSKVFLASDRFVKNITAAWRAEAAVEMAGDAEAVDPFDTQLGKALYASRFEGGPKGRAAALQKEVVPVLLDMLLLVVADEFWPTPGSTMSATVCYWREVWRGGASGVPGLGGCEEVVNGWGSGEARRQAMHG